MSVVLGSDAFLRLGPLEVLIGLGLGAISPRETHKLGVYPSAPAFSKIILYVGFVKFRSQSPIRGPGLAEQRGHGVVGLETALRRTSIHATT